MSSPRTTVRRWWRRSAGYRPETATSWIVTLTVVVYVVELLFPVPVTRALGYYPAASLPQTGAPFEPWRMLTVMLVHSPAQIPGNLLPLTHIAFNMVALYSFGRQIEGVAGIGPWRFTALYLLSGLGGSVAVLYSALAGLSSINTLVLGASGAVFGIFGATFAVVRRLGGEVGYLVALLAINLGLGFLLPNISWQAHVGGLVVGGLVGWLLVSNRGPRRQRRQTIALAVTAVVLIVLALVPALL